MSILMANVMRFIGSIFTILSDTSNETKKIYFLNAVGNVFCGIQYLLLGGMTGFISSLVTIPRNFFFYKYKNKIPFIVLIIYFIFIIVINISSVNSIISFIPVALVMIYTYALYVGDKEFIKWCVFFICLLEIIYDYKYNAYVGLFVCILDAILVLISIHKMKKINNR